LISSGYTVGIFQLEKKLGQDWAKKVKPKSISELGVLISILRPGPLEAGLSQEYVDIKFGRKKPSYLHPKLETILGDTHGIMVYQEQALSIATDLAGFNPIEADTLRKGIGKKLPEVIQKLKNIFVEGCKNHSNIDSNIAEEIFHWIEKCQRYSFNKSHAICYATTGYMTSWLKCHFPQEFFTSFLIYSQYKSDHKEEIYRLVQDARLFGIDVFPPDIRRGNTNFRMIENPSVGIAYGLSHIRGVGQSAITKITGAIDNSLDQQIGLKTWPDFLASVPHFHRNVGIALIKSGACDCYGMHRNEMVRELETILGTTTRDHEGKKQEIKGLTDKEKQYFFDKLRKSNMTTREILQQMSESPGEKSKSITQMSKSELVSVAQTYMRNKIEQNTAICVGEQNVKFALEQNSNDWINSFTKLTKKQITDILNKNGYQQSVVKPPCSSDRRRNIMAQKAKKLEPDIFDTNRANATAEKHFLGISLSCSQADDADDSLATHTCLDVAKMFNNTSAVVCAIIDLVKHTKTKRGRNPGQPMCFLTISDSTYSIDHAVVFPDSFQKLKGLCKEDTICLVYGTKKNGSFIVEDIKKLI